MVYSQAGGIGFWGLTFLLVFFFLLGLVSAEGFVFLRGFFCFGCNLCKERKKIDQRKPLCLITHWITQWRYKAQKGLTMILSHNKHSSSCVFFPRCVLPAQTLCCTQPIWLSVGVYHFDLFTLIWSDCIIATLPSQERSYLSPSNPGKRGHGG